MTTSLKILLWFFYTIDSTVYISENNEKMFIKGADHSLLTNNKIHYHVKDASKFN